jgi:hypothetical protein
LSLYVPWSVLSSFSAPTISLLTVNSCLLQIINSFHWWNRAPKGIKSEYLFMLVTWALCPNHKSWQRIKSGGTYINSCPYQKSFFQSFHWHLTST